MYLKVVSRLEYTLVAIVELKDNRFEIDLTA